MVFYCRLAAITLLLAIMAPPPARADQPLIFRAGDPDIRLRDMISSLTESKALKDGMNYDTASIDLNGDGVNEVVFRGMNPGCETRADCSFVVAGLSRRKPSLLGSFPARKVGISQEKVYGVTKLIVYNDQDNDFAYQLFYWNPYSEVFAGE